MYLIFRCIYINMNMPSHISTPSFSFVYVPTTRVAAISQETMTLHHSKHHNTYVTNLNAGLEKLDAAMSANDVSAIIGLQGALKFNGTWAIRDIRLK